MDVHSDMRSAGTRGAAELAGNADVSKEGATNAAFVTTKPPFKHAGGTVASFIFVYTGILVPLNRACLTSSTSLVKDLGIPVGNLPTDSAG